MVNELLVPNPVSLQSPAIYLEALQMLEFEQTETYKTMGDQDKIMLTLIKRNKLHLHQAFDTPFARKELQDYIGENGAEKGAKEILDRQFDPNNFNNLPAVNYWIKNNLRRVAAPNSVNILLTVEELKSLLK
eukprot:4319649-Ditylum_brightwellii.AAC.1